MKPPLQWKAILAVMAVLLAADTLSAQSSATNAQPSAAMPPQTDTSTTPAQQLSAARPTPANAVVAAGASESTATLVQQHLAPLALKAVSAAVASPALAGSVTGKQAATSEANAVTLHLIVGRSLFISVADKLRRVYVSNPAVLDALTASQFEVVITAKAPGTSSLVMWSATGQSRIYTVLADVDVAGLRESLTQALPGDHVEWKPRRA